MYAITITMMKTITGLGRNKLKTSTRKKGVDDNDDDNNRRWWQTVGSNCLQYDHLVHVFWYVDYGVIKIKTSMNVTVNLIKSTNITTTYKHFVCPIHVCPWWKKYFFFFTILWLLFSFPVRVSVFLLHLALFCSHLC